MKQKSTEKQSTTWNKIVDYTKTNLSSLIIFAICFIAILIISFFNVATAETVLSFSINEYEVGQNSDRTVVATISIPSDEKFPFEIKKGETIIKKGFDISEEAYKKLEKMAATPEYIDYRAFANSILYFMLLSALIFFLFSKAFINQRFKTSELIFYSLSFIFIYFVATFGQRLQSFSNFFTLLTIIPSTFFIILITIIYGKTKAVYVSFILFFALLYAMDFALIPSLFLLCSALASVRIVCKLQHRFDMVVASMLIAILNIVFLFALKILSNSSFSTLFFELTGVALNGFISGILALGFLTPLELMLNTASVLRLMDLSDLNIPIMRRLLLVAPGTYNHSMMVATLAENACSEIGANPLLARVGGYYHDIGKIDQPMYFTENQTGENKHDDINPTLSVSVIKSHVRKGVEKGHQLHLPMEVIDIISQHHGDSVISYFYNAEKQKDENASESQFSYSGTPPTSKEAAVVMLADTVEAACRTLNNPSASRLEKFIHTLVMGKYEHGQLDKSNLTFKELDSIVETFVTILAGYYHSRIEYPDQKDPDEETAGEK